MNPDISGYFSIPIGLSEGEILPDCEVQRSALSVIINCVCGPSEKVGIFSVYILNICCAFLEPIDYFFQMAIIRN